MGKLRKLFGQKVRQRRKELELSQEAFGHEVGFDRTYISGIERGVRNPSLDAVEKIAQALKVKVELLFKE